MTNELDKLYFDNSIPKNLPGANLISNISQQTPDVIYSQVNPTPNPQPAEILIWSDSAAKLLDLTKQPARSGEEAQILGGNQLLRNSTAYAYRYGGYQFGNWAGQLGDGRAICLGEIVNQQNQRWEIQLKGAGQTPYSRRGDGRAVLRSSLREFLCSEAMYHLGVPTTRALCCTLTKQSVIRDLFYDGHPESEPGAITTRLAPTFLRFGNFEILTANREFGLLKKLTDHAINYHFPQITADGPEKYQEFLMTIARSTATLMVDWIKTGFVHGVMNTDNMSILGLTIDYGPYGWLDVYNPQWTPNTTDAQEQRYRFENQPTIAHWNLIRLTQALEPLLENSTINQELTDVFQAHFETGIWKMSSNKLGISNLSNSDIQLITSLETALSSTEIDPYIFYRSLAKIHLNNFTTEPDNYQIIKIIGECFYDQETISESGILICQWIRQYWLRCQLDPQEGLSRFQKMNLHNPFFVLRNYLVQEALEQLANGERTLLSEIWNALQNPFVENSQNQKFFKRRPEWARNRPGCSALSCSS